MDVYGNRAKEHKLNQIPFNTKNGAVLFTK